MVDGIVCLQCFVGFISMWSICAIEWLKLVSLLLVVFEDFFPHVIYGFSNGKLYVFNEKAFINNYCVLCCDVEVGEEESHVEGMIFKLLLVWCMFVTQNTIEGIWWHAI